MKERSLDDVDLRSLFSLQDIDFFVESSQGSVREVGLDNAATTLPFKAVTKTVLSFLQMYGSVHRGSSRRSIYSTEAYEKARDTIRKFVGGSSKTYVVFTKNTTEAINHAAHLWANIPGKVLLSGIEHSSNFLPWLTTNTVVRFETKQDGTFDLARIAATFEKHPDIKLLAVTGSSNVTGYKPPLYELAKLAHQYGAKLFVDCCQLIQHSQVDMLGDDDLRHIDFLAFSGHKMYAPFGIGALVGPKEFFDRCEPYQIGGGNLTYITSELQRKSFPTVRNHDPGTPNAVGAIALAKACEILESIGYDHIFEHEHKITKRAFSQLQKLSGVRLFVTESLLGTIIPFEIACLDSKLVAEILRDDYGIGVRAGSFCTYELLRKLKQVSDEDDKRIASEIDRGVTKNVPSLVRASFGLVNTIEDADRLALAIKEILATGAAYYLQKYSQDSKTGNWMRCS